MGLLGLKVCSSSIFDCFFSKQKFDGIGFLVAVCVPCYWQPHLLFRQSFITPACWRPSPPTPLTTGVTLTPTGITCELKDVDTTECPVHRRGTSAGPPLCSCAQAPICVQAYFFLWHWEHAAKFPRTESGASSPAAGRWECWLMDYREAKKESEVAQSCPTLRNPTDCSPQGSSVHGIFQARILEWVSISFRGSSWPRDRTQVSHVAGRHFINWATREAHLHAEGVIISHFAKGRTGPEGKIFDRNSAAKTILEPKYPVRENQGIIRGGRDLEINPPPSLFTEKVWKC